MIEIQCGKCKFWEKISDNPAMGNCRRHAPPARVMKPSSETPILGAQWPRTNSDDWCGEYESIVQVEDNE